MSDDYKDASRRDEFCGDEQPHDRHEYLVGFRRFDCPGAPGCTGSRYCQADTHVHGCFADKGNCEEPTEHRSVFGSLPGVPDSAVEPGDWI